MISSREFGKMFIKTILLKKSGKGFHIGFFNRAQEDVFKQGGIE